MIYGSVCSGIESATVAWGPLGWRAAVYSEIEKFPRAVLEQRFGAGAANGPALRGDFTEIQAGDHEPIDLLVGGTPCQSFSVAGLRGGLGDDRGNLALEFLRLAGRLRPRWVVWENVPGVLSVDDGEALSSILDGIEELGYIVDIDILDAQYFGLAQRRRRVFICGQHRDDLLKKKTSSSALTIAQCLVEILHGVSVEASRKSESALVGSASAGASADGARRRMKLFGITGGADCNFGTLLEHLAFLPEPPDTEQGKSGCDSGDREKDFTAEGQSTGSEPETRSSPIAESLKNELVESYEVMKSFITSMPTNRTTDQTIYICSQAALSTGALICRSNPSCPPFWNAASSAFAAIEEFTNYARQANSSLFTEPLWFRAWGDFVGQAERTSESLSNIGIRNFGKIFSLPEGLRGDSPPRRETGQGVAPSLAARTRGGGGLGTDFDCDGGLISHALRGEGFDASEDGTGRGTPMVPVAIQERAVSENLDNGPGGKGYREGIAYTLEARNKVQSVAFSCKDHGADAGDLAPTLRAMGHDGSHANAGGQVAVAHSVCLGSDPIWNRELAMPQTTRNGDPGVVQTGYAVRRLTPRECERLQGLPDDHTRIAWRGKAVEQCPDGPRYKVIGNAMPVNVMRFIGSRIEAVDAVLRERAS